MCDISRHINCLSTASFASLSTNCHFMQDLLTNVDTLVCRPVTSRSSQINDAPACSELNPTETARFKKRELLVLQFDLRFQSSAFRLLYQVRPQQSNL